MDPLLIKISDIICEPMHYHEGGVREGIIGVAAMTRLAPKVKGVEGEDAIYSVPIVRPLESVELVIARGLLEAAKLGIKGYDLNRTDNLIARFPHSNYKIVVEVFGDSVVAVAVGTGHVINKSLRRIIKRAARRVGLKKVESGPVVTEIGRAHV